MYDDLNRFFDIWNLLGGVLVLIISASIFAIGGFTTQSVLVAVTAFYSYIAFNQMRESRWNRKPASLLGVRPHFTQTKNTELSDFGLKNFGDSPALNLRLKAVLREGDEEVDTLTVSGKEWHLHLAEDRFLSLIEKASENSSFGNLDDAEDPVFENYEEKYIELYYTFESVDEVEHPRDWSNPTEMEWDLIEKKTRSPKTIELAEIRDKCT